MKDTKIWELHNYIYFTSILMFLMMFLFLFSNKLGKKKIYKMKVLSELQLSKN